MKGRAIPGIVLPFLFVFMAFQVMAAQVEIFSVKVSHVGGRERIAISLKGLDQKPIQDVIEGGIPYTIEYQVRVMRERSLWDKTIWEGIYTRTLRLNLITKEYRIEDPTAYPMRFADGASFMKAASMAVFPLPKGILNGKKSGIYVEVRVYRNSIHLFFPLSLLAPLIRPDSDFDTGWRRVEK